MKGYLIKVTYLDGRHKGKSYLMKRGGYVVEERHLNYLYQDDVYKSLGNVKAVCTRLFNNNERNRRIEDADRKRAIEKGREVHDWYIYEHESYEPFEVEYSIMNI